MNEQDTEATTPIITHESRVPWTAPVVTLLPLRETANSVYTGNDGVGASTGS